MSDSAETPENIAQRFNVSRESLTNLKIFASQLLSWQEKINLIGPSTAGQIWTRHIADALQLIRLFPPDTCEILDLGSGAGIPGLILAIAAPVHVNLVESNGKKAAFLRESVRQTRANATIHAMRIEDLKLEIDPQIVTARALAPLPKLLDIAFPFLQHGAIGLFHKGQDVDRELTESTKSWRLVAEKHPSLIDPKGVILAVKEVSRVPI